MTHLIADVKKNGALKPAAGMGVESAYYGEIHDMGKSLSKHVFGAVDVNDDLACTSLLSPLPPPIAAPPPSATAGEPI